MPNTHSSLLITFPDSIERPFDSFENLSDQDRPDKRIERRDPVLGTAQTFVEVLATRARLTPLATAFKFLMDGEKEAVDYSYERLWREARQVAAGLMQVAAQGDRVLLLHPSGPDFIPAFFGCLTAGMIAVPAYPPKRNRNASRLEAIVKNADARVVLTTQAGRRDFGSEMDEILRRLVCFSAEELQQKEAATEENLPPIKPADLAFLQYTSGSTGDPKGVMVSHANLMHNSRMLYKSMGHHGDSRMVSWLPLYHDMGLILGMMNPVYGGFEGILMTPNAFLQRPSRWLEAISRFRATTTTAPNFSYDLCVSKISEEEMQGLDLSCLENVGNGAEPVRQKTIKAFHRRFKKVGLSEMVHHPCYGLAESSLMVTGRNRPAKPKVCWVDEKEFEQGRVKAGRPGAKGCKSLVSSGSAQGGQDLRVVDPATGQEVEEGVIGELWVAGESVARGYWNKPQESAEIFENRLDGCTEKFLRTGDLVFLRQGQVYIAGRLKDMIILRGINYYPQDIELTMESCCEDLRPGCGAAFSVEHQGEERLVLVQEVKRHPDLPLEEIITLICEKVGEVHGIRPLDVQLLRHGSVLKTSSGKIQRRACKNAWLKGQLNSLQKLPKETSPASGSGLAGAEAALDWCRQQLAGQLGLPAGLVSPDKSLARMGLDSLQAIEFQQAVRKAFGTEPGMGDLFSDQPLKTLVKAWWRQGQDQKLDQKASSENPKQMSLLPLQQSFVHALDGQGESCWALVELNWTGTKLIEKLPAALALLSQRHSALRLVFEPGEAGWRQRLLDSHDAVPVPFEQCDLREVGPDRMEEFIEDGRQSIKKGIRDPRLGICVQALALRLDDERWHLMLAFDHLVVDGASLGIILRELPAALEGRLPADLKEGFLNYVKLEQAFRQNRAEVDQPWWLKQLENWKPFPELPVGAAGPAAGGFGVITQNLEGELVTMLEELARREGITLFALLTGAFTKLWAYWTRSEQLCFNTPALNRRGHGDHDQQIVGCLADIYPLQFSSCDKAGPLALAREAQQQLAALMDHSSVSAVDLARAMAEKARRRPVALSPVTLTGAMFMDMEADLGADLKIKQVSTGAPETWLDCMVFRAGQGLHLSWNHLQSQLSRAFVQRMALQFESLLTGLLAQGEDYDAMTSLLTLEDRRAQFGLNRDYQAFPKQQLLHRTFEARVAAGPDAVALTDQQRSMTYAELDQRSNRLARWLQSQGVGPETLVGLHVQRGFFVVEGILAILKAGGAYLPMDPVYPADRLSYMVKDAQAPIVLTQQSLVENLDAGDASVVCMDSDHAWWADLDASSPAGEVLPSNLAYVIYTSGSTGKPKGVMIRHQEVVRLFTATRHWYNFDEKDVWPLFHSYSFDVSVWEIWGALLHGGRLVMVSQQASRSPRDFYAMIREEGVTVLNQTPSAFKQLVPVEQGMDESELIRSLRYIIFAGEALEFESLRPWIQRHGDLQPQLINKYGITETTVHSTYRRVMLKDLDSTTASLIGLPIPDTTLHVLDANLKPVPIGVTGELYVGGAGLGRGYLKREELTAQRYLSDPFASSAENRIYKSGDLARLLPGGELEYLGRADFQVKIRGFRIELGEIQDSLLALDPVEDAAVLVREDRPGDKRLAAYIVTKKDQLFDPKEARAALKKRLPEYMVPASFTLLKGLPLTANGKLDRRALPAPGQEAASATEVVVDQQLVRICAVFAQVLGVATVKAQDDFFELGGHSLLATQLASRLEQSFQQTVSPALIFEKTSPLEMARHLSQAEEAKVTKTSEVGRVYGRSTGPVTRMQRGLWLTQQLHLQGSEYMVPMGLQIQGLLHGEAIQKALQTLAQRHPSLRTIYRLADSELNQEIVEGLSPELEELQQPVNSDQGHWLSRQQRLFFDRPVDLVTGPLWRACWIRQATDRHQILLSVHHLALDFKGLEILLQELSTLLSGLAPDPVTDTMTMVDQAQLEKENNLEEDRRYWQRHLDGAAPVLKIPADRARHPENTRPASFHRFEIEADLAQNLRDFCRHNRTTPAMACLANTAVWMKGLSGQDDFCLGMPVSTRPEKGFDQSLGYFVNTTPLRFSLTETSDFLDCLAQARQRVMDAVAHRQLPLEEVLRLAAVKRSEGVSPLFQHLFVYQATHFTAFQSQGLKIAKLDVGPARAKFDLVVGVEEISDGFTAWIEFDQDLFDPASVEKMAKQWKNLLKQGIENPRQTQVLPRSQAGPDLPLQFESWLAARWGESLGLPVTDWDENFFDIGGHSMLAVQLVSKLEIELKKRLTVDMLFKAPTVNSFTALLRQDQGKPAMKASMPGWIVPLSEGSGPTRWFIHPVGGAVNCYRELAKKMDGKVLAIQSPALGEQGQAFDNIDTMARAYLEQMQKVQKTGPWHLAGWSMGALIACRLAGLLEEQGEKVDRLDLLEAHLPDIVEAALMQADPGRMEELYYKDLGQPVEAMSPGGENQRLMQIFSTHLQAMAGFRPQVLNCPVSLILATESFDREGKGPLQLWQKLSRAGLTWAALPGGHYDLLKGPNVDAVAGFLQQPLAAGRAAVLAAV